MAKRTLLFFALLLVARTSIAQSGHLQCVSTAGDRTVCNIAWNGCRAVPISETAYCKAAVTEAASINAKRPEKHDLLLQAISKDFAMQKLSPAMPGRVLRKIAGPHSGAALMSGVGQSPAVPVNIKASIDATTRARSEEVLAKLDKDPLDEAAQGDARELVRKCKSETTLLDMYKCSGMFVPPVVRLNCLNNGPCLPLAWGSAATPNGSGEWWGWQQYRDEVDVSVAAYSRPWVATPQQVDRCAKAATTNGVIDNSKATFCLVKELGGPAANSARNCYAKWSSSPAQFAGCLSGMTLSQNTVKQVDCVFKRWRRPQTVLPS